MDRESFLREAWAAFPPARNDWKDVADLLKVSGQMDSAAGVQVCGRIVAMKNGQLTLESGGASLDFKWESGTVWLQAQRQAIDFSPALLTTGDLVCLEVIRGNDPSTWKVHAALLLVPFRRDSSAQSLQKSPFTVQRSKQWAEFLSEVREFFSSREFIEAQTPTLVPSPGTEPFLDPFRTDWVLGSKRKELFLPTSPEFHLKKMLVRGWTRVFEFKTCFRNGEISEHHQPEFLMLEWYRAYSNLDAIADDVDALIAAVASRFTKLNDVPRLKRTTMAELFHQHFSGFQLKPATTRDELVALAARAGISVDATDSWDDVFFRLFLEKIERDLGKDGPLLVRGYPPSQAALSRIGEDGFADRFEVYWHGLELANAFHELNDPAENEARFREDARKKVELGKDQVPVDEELVRSLWQGMPPSGGIALGLDRLFMALFGIASIAECRAFPAREP